MHYNYGMLIVNKKHPIHKRIIKLINASIEHGIKVKRDEISKQAFLVIFFLLKKYAPEDMVEPNECLRKIVRGLTFNIF